MKRTLTYDELKVYADQMAEQIAQMATDFSNRDINLIAVSRGGVTVAHRIAYKLKVKLNFFDPKTKQFAWPIEGERPMLFFVEDLVAKGRTYTLVSDFMKSLGEHPPWLFCPLLVDAEYAAKHGRFAIQGFVSEDWIVFPYEDEEKVVEKDWGLFREGTSASAQKD